MGSTRNANRFWRNLERIGRTIWFRMNHDLSFLRASSLSFQTALSIVPILAVMFGIAKGFGLETLLQNILQNEFHDQKEVISYLIQFGYKLLEQTRGGIVAGIGIIVLLFTVMRLFFNIENSLNYMWGIKEGRPIGRKLADYLALIMICPILIVASSSLTVFVTTQLNQITSSGQLPEHVGPLLLYSIPLIPYVMSMLLFTLVYIVVPYTTVRLTSSLVAGFFAGLAYQILQATYITMQIKVSNAGAIYGSFAAIPLFLTWLYLSWVIFLVGAQIVVIHQERLWDPHFMAPYRRLTHFERKLAYLSCVKAAIDSYDAQAPICIKRLSYLLRIPERLVNELVDDLVSQHVLIKTTSSDSEEVAIVPAHNPDLMRMCDVLQQVEGTNELPAKIIQTFDHILRNAEEEWKQSPSNPLLKDIELPDSS